MKTICEVLGVARSNIAERAWAPIDRPRPGRPARPDEELLAAIRSIIAEMPSYGYRRVWALLRRAAEAEGRPAPNHKRVYRVMKAHGLLLQRHAGSTEARRHDGRIAVDHSNLRWCSDGFELGCDNGEKVRVAFALDCCDREAISFVATTEGIKGEDVRDLMTVAVETRFGPVNRLPAVIEWLTDNGSGYIAHETRRFAREITMKRDYARVNPLPSAEIVMRQLPVWFDHYNQLHPHKALGYRSPREFIAHRSTREDMSGI